MVVRVPGFRRELQNEILHIHVHSRDLITEEEDKSHKTKYYIRIDLTRVLYNNRILRQDKLSVC